MNKETININAQTKQDSTVELSSAPSSGKIWAARIVKRFLFLFFLFMIMVISGKLFPSQGYDAAAALLEIIPALIIASLLSRFIAIKIFGKSVINAISFTFSDGSTTNISSLDHKPGFYYGSSADADLGNLNYHDRR